MKIIKNIILSTILTIVILNIFSLKVNAASLSEMQTDVDNFLSIGAGKADGISTQDITDQFIELGKILTMIGAGIMVAVTAYMGIKYITASPEGQAKLKQQLIGLVVSGIVIFGAYNIWRIVVNIVKNF